MINLLRFKISIFICIGNIDIDNFYLELDEQNSIN